MKTKGLSFNIRWFDLFMNIIEQISCKNNILYLSDKYINLLNYIDEEALKDFKL